MFCSSPFLCPGDAENKAEDIVTAAGKEVISLRGSSIPLVSLASLLGLPEPGKFSPEEKLTVVVLGQGSQYLACAVDATLESSGIVVKSLSNQMKNVHFVFGATILGSGDPADPERSRSFHRS
ncbi:chemotaxis protein CheW [Geotalea toluenoxydans]|uniref:chemotaxis protein CheW n=1 Tax=Geotalea toluenoxydans TaxID=421624 RepID=UPI001FB386D5|nr:chemotaxis protein CheW [Geotalea toluenoxydans]